MGIIEVKNLKKYFGKVHAVDDISFDIQEGEVFGFLGPNGAGKTTTIRCLMNFVKPTTGKINIFGLDSKEESTKIKANIGYLSGDVRLYDGWTGREHISFFEKIRNQKSVANDLITKLNFNPKIKFRTLSSGNKQKLGLIIALMFSPKLLIMDEPTVGLDPLLQNTIYQILEDLKAKGTTIFISSHNMSEVDRICDRAGIIKDGKIVTIESINELKDKRMHIARISFNGSFNAADFNIDGIEIQDQLSGGLVLGVKGNVNSLIKILANYNIKELEISHASLEDIFLEFYGGVSSRPKMQNQNIVQKIFDGPLISSDDLKDIPELEE